MINRILPYLWIGLLLVSCDKQRGADTSADDSKPGSTRANRLARQGQPGPQQDLRAALADAKKLSTPAARDKALVAVAQAALELNPNLVAETLRYLSAESTERVPLIKAMVAKLMETDAAAAATWAASLDSENDRGLARGAVASLVATSDPAHAAQLLVDSGVTGLEFDRVAVKVLKNWVAQTPVDAVAWGLRLPPGESRSTAVKAAVGQWVQVDTEAASAWLAEPANAAIRSETTRYMAEALVAHPIGELLVQHAEPAMRVELEQQMGQLTGKPTVVAAPEAEPPPAPQVEPQPAPQPETQAEPQPEPQAEPAVPEAEPQMEPEEEPEE